MSGRSILAAFAGALVWFFSGWLIYGILLMDFFSNHVTTYDGLTKEMPDLPLLFLSHLIWAGIFTLVFEKWAKIRSFGPGFTWGLILGFLYGLYLNLYFLAMMNFYDTTAVLVDTVVSTLLAGLMGGVIAWVLGYKRAV